LAHLGKRDHVVDYYYSARLYQMSYRPDFRRYLQFSRERNARELSGARHECREDNGDAPGRLLLLGTICLILAACAGPVRAVRVDRAVALL